MGTAWARHGNGIGTAWERHGRGTAWARHGMGAAWARHAMCESALTDNIQHSKQTNIHVPGGIRTHNPSKRAAADPRLTPPGHWGQLIQFVPYSKHNATSLRDTID